MPSRAVGWGRQAQEELGSLQLDSPHLDWAWDTHGKVRGEVVSPTDTKPFPGHGWEQPGDVRRGITRLKAPCSLFPPSTDRFVTVGPPPVSMETRESTTAPHWHFGYIDGKFYQLQLLGRQKGQQSPGDALLRASPPAKGREVPIA